MTAKRVVVVGATGNVGSSVVRELTAESDAASVVGVAGRVPDWTLPKLEWAIADIRDDDLADVFRGADAALLTKCLHAKVVRFPAWPVRAALTAAWRLHLVPASPGLFDTVLRLPLMDTTRARTEHGWMPQHTAEEAIADFLRGLRHGAGGPTPPLASTVEGGRGHELATGVGERP